MLPSGLVVRPAASVSSRSPCPSGRIAKICSPTEFVRSGSQLESKTTASVTGSWKIARYALFPAIPHSRRRACPLARKLPYQKHPGVKEEKSKGCSGSKWVTWRSPLPEVSMENIWQLWVGFVPSGSAEARKNTRIRLGSTNPMNVSGKRKFVSWRRVLPSRKKTSLIGTWRDVPGGHGGPSAVPGSLKRSRLVRSPVTPNVGTTWLPGRTTGMGTGASPLPSIRTVKAAKLCSGFEPSGSTYVWKRTVSLSTNVGQQVRKKVG